MTKIIGRILAITGIAVLLALLAALAGLSFFVNTDRGQLLMQSALNDQIDGSISWSSGSISLWKGSIDLRDFRLYDRDNRELAGMDRLHCLVSLADLLRGALAIDRLLVEYPRADLQQGPQGNWNILDALAPVPAKTDHEETADTPASARPFIRNVIIRDARILEGSFTLYQVAENRRVTVEGIALGFRGNLLKEQGQLRATLGPLKVDDDTVRLALNQASLEGNYRKGSLERLSVQAETDQSSVDLRGSLHNLITDPTMDLSLKADLSPGELDQWIALDRVIRELVTIEADITGQPGNPTIALSFFHEKKDTPAVDPPLLEALDISARLADRVLFLDNLDLSTAGISLHVTGSVHMQEVFPKGFLAAPAEADWDALSYAVKIQQHETDLRRLPLDIPDDLEGVLTSAINLKGQGVDPQTLSADFSAQADVEGLRYDSRMQPAAVSLSAEGSLERSTLRIASLQVNTKGASLFFSGSTHLETGHIEGAAELSIPELELLPLPLEEGILAGSVNLKAFSEGTLDNPRLSLSGTADHLSWDELRIGKVDLTADLDGTGRVTLENLTITRDESKVQARGTMDILDEDYRIREDPSFTAHMETFPFQIDDFTDHADGSLAVSFDLGGTIRNPTGVIAVEGRNIHTSFQNIGHLTLAANLGDGELRVTSFRAAVPTGEFIEGSGRVGLDRSFEMVLFSDGISRTSLDSLKELELFDGTAVFHLSGSGTFDDPKIDGEVELKNLVIADVPQEYFRGHLSFSDGRVSLRGMSDFDLDATYELAAGDFVVTLKAEDMELAPYFLMANISDLRGILDATFHVEGNAADPLAGTAHAAIDQVELHMEEMGTLSTGRVDIRAADKTITLAPAVLHFPQDQSLNLEGSLHLDGSLDVSADGIFPLALAGIFTTIIDDFTGTARFSGQVKGTLSEPDMEADLEILKGGFRVNALASPAVHDITGTLRLRGSTVTLESLRGFMERGTFEADGTILLRDMKPYSMNIRLAGQDLPLDVPDTMTARLNASLTLQGRENAFNLDGDITILEALYYRDVRLRHLLADTITASTLPPTPRPSGDSLLDSIRVDLSIRHREPLLVSNNLAHLDLVPDLRLTGTLAHPVVTGRITVTSGTIYYQRSEFDVTRGVVDFLNPYRTEPTLDIESRVTIQDRRITLKVEGPPDRLAFNLTSDPPEEQGDILSLLLTGRTMGELTGHPGDATQTAANMVAVIVNATMAEDLRRTTGLDIFEIKAAGDDEAAFAERFRVTMGKELSRRLAVKYSFQTEQGELVQKTSSEYQLLENILADVFQDNQGVFGGGVRFRLEFY